MRIDKSVLNLRTMGISNWCLDKNSYSKKKKRYSIQFYDYDFEGGINLNFGKKGLENIPRDDLLKILEIFPYDVIMYQTKHGIHFVSFALLKGLKHTKVNVLMTSRAIGKQDYWTEAKDLTLRCSAKWKTRFLRKRKIVSNKPVVSLRRTSLARVPVPGEKWIVRIPIDPSPTAELQDYQFDRSRSPEGGRTLGLIRLYLTKVKQS